MERFVEWVIRAGWGVFSLTWRAAGFVIFATQAILEPVVRYALSGLAAAGMLMTLLFGVVLRDPRFPTLFMFCASLACFALLAGYYALMRCFGELGDERRHR